MDTVDGKSPNDSTTQNTYRKLSVMKAEHQFMSDMVPRLEANMLAKKASDLTAKERRGPNKWKSIQKLADDRAAIVFGMRADKKITRELQDKIDSKLQEIETKEINSKLENEKVDVTLPEREFSRGKIHPVSQVIDEISSSVKTSLAYKC